LKENVRAWQGFPIRREVVAREEAKKRIEALGEKYKLELLDAIRKR
jgi:threonyl-tRNA synthetase